MPPAAVQRRDRLEGGERHAATLPRLQRDVLDVVAAAGPVTPRDVAGRLPIGAKSARRVLGDLEARGLVVAASARRGRGRSRAYVVVDGAATAAPAAKAVRSAAGLDRTR